MSQHVKRNTKSLLDLYEQQTIESFLAYFMRFLNFCVVQQDSILHTGVCVSQSSRSTLSMLDCSYSTTDVRAASFCSCKLLWRVDECILLPWFNAQTDTFAIMNFYVDALSLFSSDIVNLDRW